VWCGVVWCGVVWCGVVWCGVIWCDGGGHGVLYLELYFPRAKKQRKFKVVKKMKKIFFFFLNLC
jgi:hypothetical protein